MAQLLATQKRKINKEISGTPGIFSDDNWEAVYKVLARLTRACEMHGLEWVMNNTRYFHDENGNPCRKVWTFTVTDGRRESTGVIIAAGAGTVADPLCRYDVVAYI